MEKLFSSKEIAEMYGVSVYTVTQNWCNKGLKFIRCKSSGMQFKLSWVENFLEEEAEKQSRLKLSRNLSIIQNKTMKPRKIRTTFNKEMRIV